MSQLKMLVIFDKLKSDLSKTDTEELIHEINWKNGKSPDALILFASVEMDCSLHPSTMSVFISSVEWTQEKNYRHIWH